MAALLAGFVTQTEKMRIFDKPGKGHARSNPDDRYIPPSFGKSRILSRVKSDFPVALSILASL
jgi:hypothetical protein